MAACLDAGATTPSTANGTSYASLSFTPASNDLLVVFVTASGTTFATPTLTDSLAAVTFTLSKQVLYGASGFSIYAFVANGLAAASARTLTFDCTGGGNASGCIIQICRVSGMSKTGATAVVQTAGTANHAGGSAPFATFTSSVQTGNPTLGCVGNGLSPAGLTPPTSWTEQQDQGYSTPTTGAEYVTRDSGFTGTTITWGATTSSSYGVLALELNATSSQNLSQSMSGSVTSTAALTTQLSALHSMSASVTTSASILKAITHAMSASVTSSASIIKQTAKSLSASVTTSAALAFSRITLLAMSASIVCSGALQDAAIFAESFSASAVLSAAMNTLLILASTGSRHAIRFGMWLSSVRSIGRGGVDTD